MSALEKIRHGIESVGAYWGVKLKHEEPAPAEMFKAIGKLGVAFRQTIEKPFFLLAHEYLSEFDLVDIQSAVSAVIRNNRYFPTISELRAFAAISRSTRASEASMRLEDEAVRAFNERRRKDESARG